MMRCLRRGPGEALVELPAEELASDARRGENAAIRKHALAEAERGQHMKQATTDQFQCGKCRQRKTQYYQMQARRRRSGSWPLHVADAQSPSMQSMLLHACHCPELLLGGETAHGCPR